MTDNTEVKAMKLRWIGLVVFLSFTGIFFSLAPAPQYVPDLGGSFAWGDDDDKLPFPKNATVTTLITTPRFILGLTGDNHRNLYIAGSGTPPCPVWQINLHKPSLIPVGFVVPAVGDCVGSMKLASNRNGDLFIVDAGGDGHDEFESGTIYTFHPSVKNPPIATIYASGVPGANNMAVDKKGNLWVTDGITVQGR